MERIDQFARALIALSRQLAFDRGEVDRVITDYLKSARMSRQRELADLEVLADRIWNVTENPAEKVLGIMQERITSMRGRRG